MCKRILNIRDNQLYAFAEIGTRLNDYFSKNNLKVKNHHYEKHLFADLCKAEGLEPGKHKGYELIPIVQKEIERVKANQPANQPDKKAQPKKKAASGITPIEEMARQANKVKVAETVKAITEEPKESELVKAYCKGFDTGAETVKAEPGDFVEIIRRKFYKDYHFFIKYAQTPEERTAITNALGNLYGNIGGLSNG